MEGISYIDPRNQYSKSGLTMYAQTLKESNRKSKEGITPGYRGVTSRDRGGEADGGGYSSGIAIEPLSAGFSFVLCCTFGKIEVSTIVVPCTLHFC